MNMKTHIAIYRPEDQLKHFRSQLKKKDALSNWSGTSLFDVGDLVLFYFTKPTAAIIAVGHVAKMRRSQTNGRRRCFFDFAPVWLLDQPVPLSRETMTTKVLGEWWASYPCQSSRILRDDVAMELLDWTVRINPWLKNHIQSKAGTKKPRSGKIRPFFSEGGTKEIICEVKYRDPALKSYAIAKYGYGCMVCGFNFMEAYGDAGEGYIELHHLKPISKRKGKHTVTDEDVIIVCANCHRVLHKNGATPIPWKELRRVVRKQRARKAGGNWGGNWEGKRGQNYFICL